MDDPGVGRHHAEVVEGLLAPAQKQVALLVAFEFQLGVFGERRPVLPNESTCTEWSITRSAGWSGLTLAAIAAQPLDRIAHRGQVGHHRHAGEVLQAGRGRA